MAILPRLTRFAPSPTGYLHLGHGRAAYEAFNFSPCLLRIEDIDHTRCTPDYTQAIYEDLLWLGFTWPGPVRVQSQHKQDYAHTISALWQRELIYPCFRTRREIAAAGATPLLMSEAQNRLHHDQPHAWRLDLKTCRETLGHLSFQEIGPMYKGQHPIIWENLSDEIIARRDIGLSYHLCVTYDDALQNITHIVRGVDLFEVTPYHIILQALMGWPHPKYYHHDIVRNKSGLKLSKRNQDTTIRSLRQNGYSPQAVLDMAFKPQTR